MSKLVIISNRVAVPDGTQKAGGLAVALEEALKTKGGIWCGWSGKVREYPKTTKQSHGNVDYLTMDLNKADHESYYLGFSNSLLWPLFHYRMGLTHYTRDMFEGYQHVNQSFACMVAKQIADDDVVWVHDYHLLTLASHLRKAQVKAPIGFFLHIPFPVPEVLSALPVHKEIIAAMCEYDVLGFQTQNDLQSFIRCVIEIGGGKKLNAVQNQLIEMQAFGRKFKVGCFPISIDVGDMASAAEQAEATEKVQHLKASLRGQHMVIGVDRLDYTKGLQARLQAFDHFLTSHPDYSGKVSYLQITPPSRTDVEEYRDLREEVEKLAAHINGTHADIDWVPIRYVNKSFSREELAGFYRAARVGWVTPLRDGMNLVAKEYVASQDLKDPGVLILSQFAGAARELEMALIVNPHDPESMSDALKQALVMPLQERRERIAAMMKVLHRNDIFHWSKTFLHVLMQKDSPIVIRLPSYIYQQESSEHLAIM